MNPPPTRTQATPAGRQSRHALQSAWVLPLVRTGDRVEDPVRTPQALAKSLPAGGPRRLVFAAPTSECRNLQEFIQTRSAKRRLTTTTDASAVERAPAAAVPGQPLPPRLVLKDTSIARVLRTADARVRAKFTRTTIHSGTDSRTLCRLSLELLAGSPAGFAALAGRLAHRFGLWLDPRPVCSIAQAVQRGADGLPPVFAAPVALGRRTRPSVALGCMAGNCLEQILPNLAEIASGSSVAEHVHQARVGVRRLRAMLRVFGDWAPDVDPAWEIALAALFRRLGEQRDRDVLMKAMLPAIQAAGGPPIRLQAARRQHVSVADVAGGQTTVAALIPLQVFAWTHASGLSEAAADEAGDLRALAEAPLKRLHARIRRDATRFMKVSDAERHKVRKRIKRLRYCVELAADLFPKAAINRFLRALLPVQTAIGGYVDLLVAESALAASAQVEPGAAFALGWIAARRPILLERAAKALKRFAAVKPHW